MPAPRCPRVEQSGKKCLFYLTPEQKKIMQPLFDQLAACASVDGVGNKGRAIVAQVFENLSDGTAFATCKVLDRPTTYRLWFAFKAMQQNELDKTSRRTSGKAGEGSK